MRNPIQELQAEELEKEEICRDILNSTRNELYLGMRFLDSALSALRPEPDTGVFVAGTDGELLRFSPDQLMKWYEKGRVEVNRLYLHMIFHCLFGHLWNRKNRDKELWNLACDIAAENLIDGLYVKCVYRHGSGFRRETYKRLAKECRAVTAGGVYRFLEKRMDEKRDVGKIPGRIPCG